MYKLTRKRDGAGCVGDLKLYRKDPDKYKATSASVPILGDIVWVGGCGKWWCTTPIREFFEVTESYIRFRTNNSEYLLEKE